MTDLQIPAHTRTHRNQHTPKPPMTAQLATEETHDTHFFTSLNEVELTDSGESWRSETRLELLAWEIARYEPALAERLAAAGKRRMLAA